MPKQANPSARLHDHRELKVRVHLRESAPPARPLPSSDAHMPASNVSDDTNVEPHEYILSTHIGAATQLRSA